MEAQLSIVMGQGLRFHRLQYLFLSRILPRNPPLFRFYPAEARVRHWSQELTWSTSPFQVVVRMNTQ